MDTFTQVPCNRNNSAFARVWRGKLLANSVAPELCFLSTVPCLMSRVCRNIVRLAFDNQAINPDIAAGDRAWSIVEDDGDLTDTGPFDPPGGEPEAPKGQRCHIQERILSM